MLIAPYIFTVFLKLVAAPALLALLLTRGKLGYKPKQDPGLLPDK